MQAFGGFGVWNSVIEQLLTDSRLRWSAVAGVAIVWLAAAWGEVSVLALLGAPGAICWLARRHPVTDAPELDDLL